MKRPVIVTTKLDALSMLDSVTDTLKCSAMTPDVVTRQSKTWGAGPRKKTILRTCAQARLPVDKRCAECRAAWHIIRAVWALEGGAA